MASPPTNLTALPLSQEAKWKTRFPGNTAGLAASLLSWHAGMRSTFKAYEDGLHPSNPPDLACRAEKPTSVPLLELQLRKTTSSKKGENGTELLYGATQPELAVLLYSEVTTFANPAPRRDASTGKSVLSRLCRRFFDRLAGRGERSGKGGDGSGRWAFFVLKGWAGQEDGTTPPYLVLAFPRDAVTEVEEEEECVLGGGADEKGGMRMGMWAVQQQQGGQGSMWSDTHDESRSGTTATICNNYYSNDTSDDRIRSSSTLSLNPTRAQLSTCDSRTGSGSRFREEFEECMPSETGQGRTVRRTTFRFEVKGKIPLVEGYRTDVGMFRPWLKAVGKGEGVIVVYCENDRGLL